MIDTLKPILKKKLLLRNCLHSTSNLEMFPMLGTYSLPLNMTFML